MAFASPLLSGTYHQSSKRLFPHAAEGLVMAFVSFVFTDPPFAFCLL